MLKKMLEYLTNSCYHIIRIGKVLKVNVMRKKIDIFKVAVFFLNIVDRDAGSTITPLKLQKLLYYAQGYFLAINDKPLFKEDFQAWAHGPANPEIYDKYRVYGSNAIDAPDINTVPEFENNIVDFLYDIWATFGIYDGKYLEELTHKEAPWINARKGYNPGDVCHKVITKESMKEFFKTKVNEN